MLALGFLLMIGMTLIADGFGFHVPKGYIYAAMGFSAFVEGLNMLGAVAATPRRRGGPASTEPGGAARDARAVDGPAGAAGDAGGGRVGYPDRLFRAVGHPVSWIGRLIAALDRRLNDPARPEGWRRAAGVLALGGDRRGELGRRVRRCSRWPRGRSARWSWSSRRARCWRSAAWRRMWRRWRRGWRTGGLAAGRVAVGRIVGRDVASLDEAGVARAAVESLAENFADGVVAPVFWMAVLGPARGGGLQGDQHRRQHDRASDASGIAPSAGRRRGWTTR